MQYDDNITMLDYEFDRALLLKEMDIVMDKFEAYTDKTGVKIDDWTVARHISFPYADHLNQVFGINGSPRFYIQKPHTVLPMHKDRGTECSINVILNDDDAMVDFEDRSYRYRQCLLNTQKMHGVKTGDKQRLLFKLSVFDEPYEVVRDRLLSL